MALADRGWKASFHLKLAIFRVYVYLPEGTINIPQMLAYIPAPWILWVLVHHSTSIVALVMSMEVRRQIS